jgi:hypothetical protein
MHNNHCHRATAHWQLLLLLLLLLLLIFLHESGRLTRSGIGVLPSFPVASEIPSPSTFVVGSVFRQSGFVRSFKAIDPVLFVWISRHVLQRYLVIYL